jgi:hypothetical protein
MAFVKLALLALVATVSASEIGDGCVNDATCGEGLTCVVRDATLPLLLPFNSPFMVLWIHLTNCSTVAAKITNPQRFVHNTCMR